MFAEKSQNPSKNANEMKYFFSIPPKLRRLFAEILRSERCKTLKYENLVDLENSKMLQNEYLLVVAIVAVDTAENEPLKV